MFIALKEEMVSTKDMQKRRKVRTSYTYVCIYMDGYLSNLFQLFPLNVVVDRQSICSRYNTTHEVTAIESRLELIEGWKKRPAYKLLIHIHRFAHLTPPTICSRSQQMSLVRNHERHIVVADSWLLLSRTEWNQNCMPSCNIPDVS